MVVYLCGAVGWLFVIWFPSWGVSLSLCRVVSGLHWCFFFFFFFLSFIKSFIHKRKKKKYICVCVNERIPDSRIIYYIMYIYWIKLLLLLSFFSFNKKRFLS
jgi:hypothetical protein